MNYWFSLHLNKNNNEQEMTLRSQLSVTYRYLIQTLPGYVWNRLHLHIIIQHRNCITQQYKYEQFNFSLENYVSILKDRFWLNAILKFKLLGWISISINQIGGISPRFILYFPIIVQCTTLRLSEYYWKQVMWSSHNINNQI